MKKFTILLFCFLCAVRSASAQGFFQNLDFESATLVPIPGDPFNRVYFDQAFPGWRGYVGATQETAAFHNGMFLCCSSMAIWGGEGNPDLPIEGTFSAAFHAALGYDNQPADTRLVQTGFVPVGTQSLLFKAQAGAFSVALAGQSLTVVRLSSTSDYTLFGADISAWAGQQSEVSFTAIAPEAGGNFWVLDSIQFSSEPIPEPSTFAFSR